jgi:hypothetical protein
VVTTSPGARERDRWSLFSARLHDHYATGDVHVWLFLLDRANHKARVRPSPV